jgi:hypothetical protein
VAPSTPSPPQSLVAPLEAAPQKKGWFGGIFGRKERETAAPEPIDGAPAVPMMRSSQPSQPMSPQPMPQMQQRPMQQPQPHNSQQPMPRQSYQQTPQQNVEQRPQRPLQY